MYAIIRSMSARDVSRSAAAFGISLILAELLFKFHSFSLECVAFLCTWFVVDMGLHALVPGSKRRVD